MPLAQPTPECETIRPRVLVVEDDDGLRDAVSELLRMEGYELGLAEDGEQGLAWLTHEKAPDLILLDMRMPRMDGNEFLGRCQADRALANIPVVAVSATQQEPPQGVQAFVRKPCDPRALLDVIAECLRRAAAALPEPH